MSKEPDCITAEGRIAKVQGYGFFLVVLDNGGHEILARLSGRMVRNHIKCLPDDRVAVEIGLADMTRGRITYRHK